MGLGDRLRRLDDRLVPRAGVGPRRPSWLVAFGVIGLIVLGVAVVLPRLDEPARPLGFDCLPPVQPVVEEVLDLTVDASGSVGGPQSREATAYWASGGRKVLLVTCRSASESDIAEAAASADEPGYVAGDPPFVLVESAGQDAAVELRFAYGQALVVIETASPVDEAAARTLVASWVQQVEGSSPR